MSVKSVYVSVIESFYVHRIMAIKYIYIYIYIYKQNIHSTAVIIHIVATFNERQK